jgi:DNA-binding NtrC family response regulator
MSTLVFSDVVMPKVDGVLLARQIGKRKPRLPVVLTTGRVDLVEWIVNRGGVALIKPYSIERLKAVFTEQLCPPSPENTSSQTRVVVKRTSVVVKRTSRKAIDRRQIDLRDSTDVRYWCRRFRCTQSALRAAIKLLGTDPTSVEKYLMTRPSR